MLRPGGLPLAEQTVTEHVTGHVANADCGELFGLSVVAELSEVTLDGLPCTTRGDAHSLVVVTGGAAGCERSPSQKPRSRLIAFAVSENAAVPLSAATTR